LGGLQSTTL